MRRRRKVRRSEQMVDDQGEGRLGIGAFIGSIVLLWFYISTRENWRVPVSRRSRTSETCFVLLFSCIVQPLVFVLAIPPNYCTTQEGCLYGGTYSISLRSTFIYGHIITSR